MIVTCPHCQARFDDEYRWTICPHETFAANDGRGNFKHHPEAYLGLTIPAPVPEAAGDLKLEPTEDGFLTASDFEALADPLKLSWGTLQLQSPQLLRGLTRPLLVCQFDGSVPDAVVMPYALYLRLQETLLAVHRGALRLVANKGDNL